MVSISTNWASSEIEKYRIYVDKLRKSIFRNPADRKRRIKNIISLI